MRVHVLGSCSGTEPMPGRKHTALLFEAGSGLYWFDAGEGCSYTAHLMGLDLLRTRAIVISHPHADHIGGLPNLLFNLHKLHGRAPEGASPLSGATIAVRVPEARLWEGLLHFTGREDGAAAPFAFDVQVLADGLALDDGVLRVTARHNRHMGLPQPGGRWRSYSFRIAAEGRSVVYSGDVHHTLELAPLLEGGCDLLLMETGHHRVEDVCATLNGLPNRPARLAFVHHGRAILHDPRGELDRARTLYAGPVLVTEDGQTIEV